MLPVLVQVKQEESQSKQLVEFTYVSVGQVS